MGDQPERGVESHDADKMTDAVIKRIGKWGRWQLKVFALLSMKNILAAWQVFSANFTAPELDHWCARPQNSIYSNWTADQWKEFAIPIGNRSLHGHDRRDVPYSQCDMYDISDGYPMKDRIIPCTEFEYDHSVFPTTITSEWNLVCGRNALRRLLGGLYMAGYFAGVLSYGIISDKFGRRNAMLAAALQFTVFSISLAFCQDLYTFLVLRFITAAGLAGAAAVSFVLMMELIGGSYRSTIGIAITSFFSIGSFTLPALAYFVRPWRDLQLAVSVPTVFTVLYYWYLPESPRWLLSQGRTDEAEKIMAAAEKTNSSRCATNSKAEVQKEVNGLDMTHVEPVPKKTAEFPTSDSRVSLLHLFKTPNMRKKTINLYYIWFVNAFVYYGLSLNLGDLGGDVYVTAAVTGFAECIALVLGTFAIMHIGRRLPLSVLLLTGGVACTLITVVPSGRFTLNWPVVALASIGKCGISGSFAIIYIVSAEIFPTIVRNTGVGSSSMFARIGSIIAPFVPLLDDLVGGFRMSMLLYGSTAVLAGLVTLFLPETNRKKLPETMEDGENFK